MLGKIFAIRILTAFTVLITLMPTAQAQFSGEREEFIAMHGGGLLDQIVEAFFFTALGLHVCALAWSVYRRVIWPIQVTNIMIALVASASAFGGRGGQMIAFLAWEQVVLITAILLFCPIPNWLKVVSRPVAMVAFTIHFLVMIL